MEDSKYYEIRERIIEQLHQFINECRSLGMDTEDEVDDLLRDMWDSAI